MAHHIKTAISMEESLFNELVRLARDLRMSRSRLIAVAVEEFIERRSTREMMDQLNKAYADDLDDEERAFLRFARRQQRRIAEAES
jgi:metal-responsive CopG/Arc/MetJ family transcriptional regulator